MIKYHIMPCGCKFEIVEEFNDGRPPKLKFDYNKDFQDCKEMWRLLWEGKTLGIFQLESGLGKHFCKELRPENLLHIEALGAALRPGCLQSKDENKVSITQHYCNKKNGKEDAVSSISILTDLLKDTYGEMLFQEDIMRISIEIAGYDGGQADDLRKGVGAKDAKKLFALEESFIEGCKKVGKVTEEEAKTIFGWIKSAARYSFNKCCHKSTIIKRLHKGKYSQKDGYTVEHMYKIKNDIKYAKQCGQISLYKKWKLIKNYGKGLSLCEDGRIRPNTIVDIQPAGQKLTFKVVLENKCEVIVTDNHKFPTPHGLKPLYDLKCGDELYTCGNYESIGEKGYPSILSKIISITPYETTDTYDITMDSPNHNFVVGGNIVIGNSHSNQYSHKACKTLFFKYHFPVQFYTAKLKGSENKIDTEYTIGELVDEAKLFNIKVKLPDLRKNRPTFFTNGKDIYYGLTNIKGIGLSIYEKQIEKIKKYNLNNYSFFRFCTEIAIVELSDSVVIKLIESGALDFFRESRIDMLNKFKILKEFTSGENGEIKKIPELVKTNNINDWAELLEKAAKLKKDGGVCHSKPRVEKLNSQLIYLQKYKTQENNPIFLSEKEQYYLGIPISSNKTDAYDTTEVTCTIKDYLNDEYTTPIIFGGEIVEVKVSQTKTGKNIGKNRAEFILRDLTGKIKINVWSDTYEKCDSMIMEGNCIIVEVQKGSGSFSNLLSAKMVQQARV